jgi:hypothetical protein
MNLPEHAGHALHVIAVRAVGVLAGTVVEAVVAGAVNDSTPGDVPLMALPNLAAPID